MFGNLWSQLSLKNFLAKHDNPYVFISSQWQNDKSVPNGKYLIYRITVTIYLFLTWLLSIVLDNVVDKWPIYLTNWGYTTCTLQSLLASLMLLGSYVSMRRGKGELIKTFWKAYPVYWILNTIATPTAFGITTIYWSIIYDPKKMNFTAINFFVHGSNSLVMFFDVWIVCHPIKLLHFIYPIIFGVFYVSFSAVYFVAGGTARGGTKYIYKFVDWEHPFSTILTCLGITCFLLLLHLLSYGLSQARMKLHETCCVKKHDVSTRDQRKRDAAYVNDVFC